MKIKYKTSDYFRYLFLIYIIFAYLFIPLLNYLIYKESFDYSNFIAVISILFMASGIFLGNKFILKRRPFSANKSTLNSKYLILASLSFLLLSFAAKILHQIPSLISGDIFHTESLLKPNFLTEMSLLSIMSLCIAHLKSESKSKKIIFLLILVALFALFLIWNSVTGVGRSLAAYLVLGLILNYFMVQKFSFRQFFLFFISFLFLWFFISAYKTVAIEGQSISVISGMQFFSDKFLSRFSHSIIFSQVVTMWPKGISIYFYGWQDFFTMPALGFHRYYLDGNDFGHAMNVIADTDFKTGVGPTFLGDLYMRGREFCCFTGFFLIGLLLCFYDLILLRLSVEKAFVFNGILSVFFIHGSEDFIFLTLSTSLIIFLFVSAIFYLLEKLLGFKSRLV